MRILRQLSHPNVIGLVHLQHPGDLSTFSDLYIVMDFMDTDMSKLVHDATQCLTLPHVRWFLYQLLLAIKYIHSARILHRDIKPANLLLSEACDLKVCDFGLARSLDDESGPGADGWAGAGDEEMANGTPGGAAPSPASSPAHQHTHIARQMTRHVVTRWYRAPELPLYNDGAYTTAIDVWSIGCCFAELLGMLDNGDPDSRYDRRALFPGGACAPLSKERPGAEGKKRDQLAVIFDVLGTPTEEEMSRVRTPEAASFLRSLPKRAPENLSKRYPGAGSAALDLLRSMLRFHAGDRCTVEAALAHPFLESVRRPSDEVGRAEGAIHWGEVNSGNIRERLGEEIMFFNAGGAAAGGLQWRGRPEDGPGGVGV